MKVGEEAVSQCLFHPTGRAQKEIPPDIPKSADTQSEEKYLSRVKKETGRRYPSPSQIINYMFDNPWDEELENIDDKQGEESDEDSPPVL